MKIALVGLQKSGKTTIYNALTGQSAEVSGYSQKAETHLAVVDVEDPRVDFLSGMYKPRKTVYATVEFLDFAGVSAGSAEHGVFSGETMQLMKTADCLCIVIRNFDDPVISETIGVPDPGAEIETVFTELILADQIVAERRLGRIQEDIKKGKKTPALQTEEKLIEQVVAHLNDGKPVREMNVTEDEKKILSGFQFLSAKPSFGILNSDESGYGSSEARIESVSAYCPVVEFAGNFEMDLNRLEDPEERQAFMEDIGITQSARIRLTTFAYRTLGYISFFTVGADEVRAWSIRKNCTAVDAAGAIHSDLARGFIRAEVFTCEDLRTYGSEKGVREAGRFRVEGKSYIVQDGDILNIRFSV
jgi:ribosome-binding ATPase